MIRCQEVCFGTCFSVRVIRRISCGLLTWLLQILPPPIMRSDFDKVLAKQKPTVSKSDLEIQEKFTQEFGEEG